MKMVQVEFERKVRTGIRHTTAWVDAMWKLKPGHSVIFDGEDGDRRWTCVRVGSIVMEYQEINSRWKVGGL